MLYPERVIEEVRIRNDIVDVISGYVKLEKKGKSYMGLCPFHGEKTPSFSVEPVKQFFYCFGCNRGGSVIQFIMLIENLEFVDALKMLAERAGMTLPEPDDHKERERARLRKEILEINREAARFFFKKLTGSLEAQGYLKKRGLQEKTIKKFGLGYSPPGWSELTDYLTAQGASGELLLASGLSVKTKSGGLGDRFRHRIMFPIFDIRGGVIGFGGRVLDGSNPKYMNSPDTPVYDKSRELYGLNFARMSSSKRLLIVEGYMDVISLHQAGIDFAVASLGTALTQMQAWILKKYSSEVIISYDSDSAGQAATLRGLDILEKAGCEVRVLILPEGKDPDEYIRNNGPEKFKNLVDRAISLLEYKIGLQKNMHKLDTIDDKLKLLNGIADTLAGHDNAIEREMYARNYAQEYGISLESLQTEINRRLRRKKRNSDYSRVDGKKIEYGGGDRASITRYGELERMLLVILCHDNNLYSTISQSYPIESFRDDSAREIAKRLYEKLNEDKACQLVELVNALPPGEAAHLVRLSETKCGSADTEKAMKQVLNKLEILRLEDSQRETVERLKSELDGEARRELAVEFSIRAEKIAELKRMD
jgi:DNA primase